MIALIISIIGRNKEVALLRKAIVQYSQHQNIYIIHGPSGSGCSSLLQEAHRFATERCIDNIFLHNTSSQQGQYQGFANLQKHPLLAPYILELLSGSGEGSHTQSRWIVYENIVKVLQQKNRVLIMDNIDRADEGTLELLRYILRNHTHSIRILSFHQKTTQVLDLLQKFSHQQCS